MKFRSTWILVVVLAIVAAYFFLVEERSRKTEMRRIGEGKYVFPYGREEVEKIVLINPDRERIEMERDGEEWTITHPTRTRGSKPTIDAFLLQIVPGIKVEQFTDVADLNDFGFGDPFATVILSARGRTQPDTIHVGDKTPTSAMCYIRLGSSRDVVITREMTHNVMNKNLYHLRDKNLLDIEPGSIDRLIVRNGAVRITLVKGNGDWRFEGSRQRADRLTIEQYLSMLTEAIIRGFVREDLSDLTQFGLLHPFRELVVGRGGDEIRISFGRTEQRMVYAVRSGIDKVMRLREELLNIFSFDEQTLRARDLAFFEIDDVMQVRAETADTTVVVAKSGADWRMIGPDSVPVAGYAVRRLLYAVRSLRFEELFDAASAPPEIRDDAASISITLEDESGGTLDCIMIASSTGGYEFGSSTSAMAFGKLEDGTVTRIAQILIQLQK